MSEEQKIEGQQEEYKNNVIEGAVEVTDTTPAPQPEQEQMKEHARFTEAEVASMMLCVAILMGINPHQFGRVIQNFNNNPNKVIRTFKAMYGTLAQQFADDDVPQQEDKPVIIVP